MHRGVLLLPWVTLAAMASWAVAQDELARAQPGLLPPAPALSPAGPPIAPQPAHPKSRIVPPQRGPQHPPKRQPSNVRTTRYDAQQPNPDEPLGISEPQLAPEAMPEVDPEMAPDAFDDAIEPSYEAPDPYAPAPSVSSGDWLRSGAWYTEQSAVYIQRSAHVRNRIRLAEDLANLNLLNIPGDLGYQPGLRSTLGRYLGRDARNREHSVEFTFLGLTHWQFAQSITAETPGAIFQSVDPLASVPVFDGSNTQAFDETADLNSYEVNYRIDRRLGRDRLVYTRDSSWVREATPSLLCSIYSGVRVVIVNERLDWTASNALGDGSYVVVTHNNLVGPQIGADMFYERAYWRMGIRANAGGLVNWASQSSTVRILQDDGEPLAPNRDEFAKNHTMGFSGGVTFIGEWRFRPGFGLRASYDLFWVTDLALAANQLTFFPSAPTELSLSHSLFFQGFTLGFEWFR